MTRPAQTARRPTARHGWRAVAGAWVLASVVVSLWGGCAVSKENYSTLKFFFDGVPDPFAPPPGSEGPGDSTITTVVTVHKPFAEEKCDECHKNQYKPGRNDPSACLKCHEKIGTEHKWTHGAVSGGACLWCHSPHESARKWLLRAQDRKLCMQCHSATMMNGQTVPAHIDPSFGCIECHFGHGGDDPLMLKPGATRLAAPPAEDGTVRTSDPAGANPTPAPPQGETPSPAPVLQNPK